MIAAAIEKILGQSTAKPREAVLKENERLWLYNDVERKYEEEALVYVRRHTV